MSDLILAIGTPVIVGIILLVIEYRTRWFARHLRRNGTNSLSVASGTLLHTETAQGRDNGLVVTPIDAEVYFGDCVEPFNGRVVIAQFELENRVPGVVYIQELRIGMELGIDLGSGDITPRHLYHLVFKHTLTLWTLLQRGTEKPPHLCASRSMISIDSGLQQQLIDLMRNPDASRVSVLNAVDQEPIQLDRWIEMSERIGRRILEVVIFLGKPWVDVLYQEKLRVRNVYLNLILDDRTVRVGKAWVSSIVPLTSEAKKRSLYKAIFGYDMLQS